ncbi:MAG: hypothetical protein HYV07_04470 [Deltaproteobacteria bacterium]|nr:hypothetical protein [Deltaproteobacteria bacterium]
MGSEKGEGRRENSLLTSHFSLLTSHFSPRVWPAGCCFALLLSCGRLSIPAPPGANEDGAVIYVTGLADALTARASSGFGNVSFELERSPTTVLAGLYPVTLEQVRLPEGVLIAQSDGRPLPAAASTFAFDEAEDAWREIEGWPAALRKLRVQSRPRERTSAIVAAGAGMSFSCALRGDGRVACWGTGSESVLGVEGVTRAEVPIEAPVGELEEISLGDNFACGIDREGVGCWGDGHSGQLGNNHSDDTPRRQRIPEVDAPVSVAAGTGHACSLSSAGRVQCWGNNITGAVGPSSGREEVFVPAPVALPALAVEVVAGGAHSCARLATREVWCWGANDRQQLGAVGSERGPLRISGIPEASDLASGKAHACIRATDGSVWCWGARAAPSRVDELTRPGELVAGAFASCVLSGSGELACIGASTDPATLPEPLGHLGPVRGLALHGASHACAVMLDGGVECWGWGGLGQLGALLDLTRRKPTRAPTFRDARKLWVDVGGRGVGDGGIVCAELADGSTECSGAPPIALTPLQSWEGSSPTPVRPFRDLTTSGPHQCVVTEAGEVACAGANELGQLGRPDDAQGALAVVAGVEGAESVASGFDSTYALLSSGELVGWGANYFGQLGIGQAGSYESSPVHILSDVREVCADGGHACAIAGPGREILCWGDNQRAELGTGRLGPSLSPERAVLPGPAASVSCGSGHGCAALENGELWCWGSSNRGQLGLGDNEKRVAPVRVPGIHDAASVSLGSDHTCVLHETGLVSCFGLNTSGQLGIDSDDPVRSSPANVVGLEGVRILKVAGQSSCALGSDGSVSCWGSDSWGQFGLGTRVASNEPLRVLELP